MTTPADEGIPAGAAQTYPVKSRPVYTPLEPVAAARVHLLVAEEASLATATRLHHALADMAAPVELYWLGAKPNALTDRATLSVFDTASALITALKLRLQSAFMGLHLYLAGTEAFVWTTNRIAHDAGLREDEISRESCDSSACRVFCVHCRHLITNVTTDPVACPACGVVLEVRDHFSRTLAAYLGVVADPCTPYAAGGEFRGLAT